MLHHRPIQLEHHHPSCENPSRLAPSLQLHLQLRANPFLRHTASSCNRSPRPARPNPLAAALSLQSRPQPGRSTNAVAALPHQTPRPGCNPTQPRPAPLPQLDFFAGQRPAAAAPSARGDPLAWPCCPLPAPGWPAAAAPRRAAAIHRSSRRGPAAAARQSGLTAPRPAPLRPPANPAQRPRAPPRNLRPGPAHPCPAPAPARHARGQHPRLLPRGPPADST